MAYLYKLEVTICGLTQDDIDRLPSNYFDLGECDFDKIVMLLPDKEPKRQIPIDEKREKIKKFRIQLGQIV